MMRGGGGMGMGRPAWRRDESVRDQQLTPGILKRVLKLALEYKGMLALFLASRRRRRRAQHPEPADPARHHQQRHRRPRQPTRHQACLARGRDRHPRHARHARAALRVGAHRRVADLRPAPSRVRTRAANADRVLHPHPDRRARQPPEQRHHRRAAGIHQHARLGREQRDHGHDRDRRDARPLVADHARVARAPPPVRDPRTPRGEEAAGRSPASATSFPPT